MNGKYQETIRQVIDWAQDARDIKAVILIGSQARSRLVSDEWSDLDLMVMVEDPDLTFRENSWIRRFGTPVCCFDEIVPLHFDGWRWLVKRVLYTDNRDIDFSILPYSRLESVLRVNRHILSKGYQVIYESCAGSIEANLCDLFEGQEISDPAPITEEELQAVASELLYHVIWAYKKVKRGELWVAVSCINCHMKELLLKLIEAYNLATQPGMDSLNYNGRFLERRTAPEVLAAIKDCFTHYDQDEAVDSLLHIMGFTHTLVQAICAQKGYAFDGALFSGVEKLFHEMKDTI